MQRSANCAVVRSGRAPAAILLCCLLALALLPLGVRAQQAASGRPFTRTGTYKEAGGATHSWQVTEAHTLIWDGTPYLPVGGRFTPRSLDDASDSAWQADVQALSTLKTKGLLDLILWPVEPLPDVPLSAFQRLITYLDANGFRYGLAFGPGITAPLTGMVVRPNSYRFLEVTSATASWNVTHTDRGLVIQVDTSTDENKLMPSSGIFPIRDNVLSLPLETPVAGGKLIAFLYPHKVLPAAGEGTPPDLWNAYDDYRDRVLAFLSQVKLGKGLRFFLDPLARHIGLADDADYLVPDSPGFLLEWESFLERKYPNLEDLRKEWTLIEGLFKTHRDLARLIPLWEKTHGMPYLYDTVSHQTYRIADGGRSRWWSDFLECRNGSLLYYMNAMADLLKHQVADVPVVYTWTQMHPIFANPAPSGGYDGLGIAFQGTPSLARVLGPAYGEAELARQTTWCVATEIGDELPALPKPPPPPASASPSPAASPAPGGAFASRALLFGNLDRLKRVGIKGFFTSAFQSNPADAASADDWLRFPERLDWLHDYATQIESQPSFARLAPRVLFYPESAPGPAHIGPVPGAADTLWLGSFSPGQLLDWWPSYSGYSIQQGETSQQTVLVSLEGRRETHFLVEDAKAVRAATADGTPVPIKIVNKNEIAVVLDVSPTVFETSNQPLLVPREAAEDVMIQLEALLAQAERLHVSTAESSRGPLEQAHFAYNRRNYDEAFTFARSALDSLTALSAPYIWLEGEGTALHENTFQEIAPNAAASSGYYLRLSSPNPPSRFGYGAHYDFDVVRDGKYNIWLAGSIPGPNVSPILWHVDMPPDQHPLDATPRGPLYLGDRFGWILLGTVSLSPGKHVLAISVTDRAQASADYNFAIDAILLTPGIFTPNGTIRPLPVDSSTVRELMKDKHREKF